MFLLISGLINIISLNNKNLFKEKELDFNMDNVKNATYVNTYPREVVSVLWTGRNIDEVFNFILNIAKVDNLKDLKVRFDFVNDEGWLNDEDSYYNLVLINSSDELVVKVGDVLFNGEGRWYSCSSKLFSDVFRI